MIDSNLLTFVFFIPLIIICILLYGAVSQFFTKYRKVKNPDFPLLTSETTEYLNKNPLKFFAQLPFVPFMWWKIIFEKQSNESLKKSAKKVRLLILSGVLVILFNFILFAMLLNFNLIR